MTAIGASGKAEVDRLLSQCLSLILDCDFPEIWSELLCRHPTVLGPPIRHDQGWGSEIRVALTTGDSLAFDLDARIVALRAARRRKETSGR